MLHPNVFMIIPFSIKKNIMFKTSIHSLPEKNANDREANYEQFLPTDLIASA